MMPLTFGDAVKCRIIDMGITQNVEIYIGKVATRGMSPSGQPQKIVAKEAQSDLPPFLPGEANG